MGYEVMSVEKDAKDFIVEVQTDNNFSSQSEAIRHIKKVYEAKKHK